MPEGCCRRGAAWPPVAGSFALGGGSREMGWGHRSETAAQRGDENELSRVIEGVRVGEVLAAGLPQWWLVGGAMEGECLWPNVRCLSFCICVPPRCRGTYDSRATNRMVSVFLASFLYGLPELVGVLSFFATYSI